MSAQEDKEGLAVRILLLRKLLPTKGETVFSYLRYLMRRRIDL